MRKFLFKLFLVVMLVSKAGVSCAQWITIPDANFVTYLQQNFPGCMNGNLMDTTCSGVVNAYSVDCNSLFIQNLDGIQYFDGLIELKCGYNLLTVIPVLPSSLLELECQGNQLTSLPDLPPNFLNLNCHTNQLTSLPVLPSTLTDLYCPLNQLTSLPPLPVTLGLLNCANNLITSLPALPAGLQALGCQYNLLTSLPPLPHNLINLFCNNNLLTSLPILPDNLYAFVCNSNQIYCLPPLPNSIGSNYFDLSSNLFTCLPNYIAAMDSAMLSIPICTDNDLINNPNFCTGFKGIYGQTYSDADSNCALGWSDDYINNIPVKLFDSSGILINTYYSLSNGLYSYILDTGTYSVVIDTLNKPFISNCIYPGTDSTVTLTSANQLSEINFDIACKSGFDVGVKSVSTAGVLFPGLPHQLNVAAGDLNKWYNLNCTGGIGGNVTITVTGPVTFSSIPFNALMPTNILNNVFTYNIADWGPLNLNAFAIGFTIDITAQSGDQICVVVNVTPTSGDNDTTNNQLTFLLFGNQFF